VNIAVTWRACAAGLSLLVAAALGPAASAWAVPPPPPRTDVLIDLQADGNELMLRDVVRAYQPVPVAFHAQAGDRLLLRLIDSQSVLVLGLEGPSGRIWMTGARPGPDGLELFLFETGLHRLQVLMSADAARAGRAANFELGLRRR
jgi:hypothetical protein